ncbi:hypothetical protein CTAYLR_007915 [Chrysophaeum taylorii]|uniref:AB hydrolase-1 domain-containing protein n=1 Tax=Chrysophaeum taylorii TaxID=2483200 RepID=A0AAD7XJK6_9STRA|nr:hypothetical protein CTAYLR_007915 [Chrysophaeum taylorii]
MMRAFQVAVSVARCAAVVQQIAPKIRRTSTLAVSEVRPPSEPVAPPLVILHGLLGHARNFRSWAAALAPQLAMTRRCISLDLVNHGDSFSRPSMDYEQMADDVVATLDALGIDEAAILGHSMGGKVAMMTAIKVPTRVERLCVFDMAPAKYSTADGSQWRATRQVVEAMAGLDIAQLPDRRAADAKLAHSVLDPNIRAFALSNLVASDDGLYWKCNLDAIIASLDTLSSWDVPDGLHYPGPTLFLAGAKSRYIRSVHLPDIGSSFPNFALRTVANAGHWIHAEDPETTVEYTRDFLDTDHPTEENGG